MSLKPTWALRPLILALSTTTLLMACGGGDSELNLPLPVEPVGVGAADTAPVPAATAFVDTGVTNSRSNPCNVTLATNAILLGAVRMLSHGSPMAVPAELAEFSHVQIFGVPTTLLLAVAFILVVSIMTRSTLHGRRFVAVGANPATARPMRRGLVATLSATDDRQMNPAVRSSCHSA